MKKDSYCVLPFNHMNFHPNGNVSLCCVSKMSGKDSGFYKNNDQSMCNFNDTPLKDMWEDSSVKKIREQMLKGELPSACEGCRSIEKNGGVSRRQIENKRWGIKDTPSLEFLDLRISNKCNLKCMMCFPDSSTSLQNHYAKWSEKLDFVQKNPVNNEKFKWFNENTINQIIEHKDTIKYLYINGGEPFIMEEHWQFLQRLIDEGVSHKISVSYNTNCTTYDKRCTEIWSHFYRVTLGLSIDAIGKKNTFIRYPSDWEILKNNVQKFFDNPSLSHINITCSIQWLNAPYMEEFYEWALPIIKKRRLSTINQNFIVFPNYLSLNCASKKFKQKLKKNFEESKYSSNILTPTMISYLDSQEEDKEIWKQGFQFCEAVEETRNMGKWQDLFNYNYKDFI